jgi:hypothetical protein
MSDKIYFVARPETIKIHDKLKARRTFYEEKFYVCASDGSSAG